jgi:hypothetical protein
LRTVIARRRNARRLYWPQRDRGSPSRHHAARNCLLTSPHTIDMESRPGFVHSLTSPARRRPSPDEYTIHNMHSMKTAVRRLI